MRIEVLILLCFLLSCGQSERKEKKRELQEKQETSAPPREDTRIILFFGNSITAGYGLDPDQAFPSLIQKRLDSLGYPYKAVNAGLSGETSAGGLNRIEWVLNATVPDIFVLELGANDGLRGLDLSGTKQNLQRIIDKVKSANPDAEIVIAGMEVPPNLGQAYAQEFHEIFPSLAEANDIILIPFILDQVAGNPELNQADGIHPTARGHELIAENVWKVIQPLLEKNP